MNISQRTKVVVMAVVAAAAAHVPLRADTHTNEVDGVTWQYTTTGGKVSLGTGRYAYDGRAIIGTPPVDLVIPAEIDGMPVVEIAKYGFFWYSTELASVTIPEGVTNIAYGAFDACRALKRVVIPSSVKTIDCRYGWPAFGGCTSLEEVVFMGDIGSIDMDISLAFRGTPWLENQPFSLVVKNGTVSGFIGRCPATVAIPEGVTAIGSSAFSATSATKLVQVVLPESLTYIRDSAFYGCNNLQSIHIPANVWFISSNAFGECVSLAAVTFGREDWLDYYDMQPFYGTPFFDTLPFRLQWRMEDGCEHERFYISGYIGRCPDNLDLEAIWADDWAHGDFR